MKYLALLIPIIAYGQMSIVGPSGTVKAGQSATFDVNIAGASAMAAAQGHIQIPAGWLAQCSVGVQPAKTASCSVDSQGKVKFLVHGMNQNVLVDGRLLRLSVTVPAGTGNGTKTITLSGPLGSSPSGSAVSVGVAAVSAFLKSRK